MDPEAPSSALEIVTADLGDQRHCKAILDLLDAYAGDLPGHERGLSSSVRSVLIEKLRHLPHVIILLAIRESKYVGLAVCVESFSTFTALPVINVHDLAVLREHRGRGIGTHLLNAVEALARGRGCCKITLEVQERNEQALRLYERHGFSGAVLAPSQGRDFFLSKTL